jgi:hypothetical protein
MNMKNISLYLMMLVYAFCGSCSDFLEELPPNAIATETFYSTEEEILFAANGVYATFRAGYYKDMYLFTDIRSNTTTVQDPGGSNGTNWQFFNYTLRTDNAKVKSEWGNLYKVIARSNVVLDHIDNITFKDETTRSRIKAEMQFMRALTYFHLVTLWGDVPLVTTELKSMSETFAHTKRDPKSEVYALIINDLEAAVESKLPDKWPAKDEGRVSKTAARALFGKVLLQKAADADFASERMQNLQAAKTQLQAAWAVKPFDSLSEINYADVFDKEKQKNCAEIIFQVMYLAGSADLSSNFAQVFQPTGSKYTNLTSVKSGGGLNLPTQEIVNEYETGDIRKDISLGRTSDKAFYYTKKYIDREDANAYGANSWIVLRYADVALLLAEVKTHLNETDAVDYINEVRTRAGLPNVGVATRDAIVHERKVELAFEGQSWYDLLRLYSKDELKALIHAKNENFSDKDFLMPIPFDEYKLNPEGMYQNKGYN